MIGFPRGAGLMCRALCRPKPGSTRSGSTRRCRRSLPATGCSRMCAVQGNLDPVLLLAGGAALRRRGRGAAQDARAGPVRLQSRPRCLAANAAGACRRIWRGCWLSRCAPVEMTRRAVVLMNLGGPDSLRSGAAVSLNLFSDPAIITPAGAVALAAGAADRLARAKTAREIYRQLGGGSPLLANTEAQARALEARSGRRDTVALSRCAIGIR